MTHLRRFSSLILPIMILVFGFVTDPQLTYAQVDPLSGLTLGAALKVFGDQVKEIEEKAIGGGLMLEIQAGGQIGVLIQQANVAYQADLDLTYSRLNAAEQQTVNNIASLVNDYTKQIYDQAKDITSRAQQIANTLPLSKTFPQLTSFRPTYAVQDSAGPINIVLNGNFVDVAREGYNATASLNGKVYTESTKTTDLLSFAIPTTDLNKDPNQVTPNPIDVKIPYQETAYWFFTTQKTADFTIPLAVLPKQVGTVTFTTDLAKPGTEQESFTTGEIDQDSVDDDIKCGGEHADLAIHSVPPDPGWTIIPSSVTWNVLWSQGHQGSGQDWWLDRNCSTPTAACLCVSTEHHRVGTSGKVHFKITYAAERPTIANEHNQQAIALQWGEQKIFDVPVGGTWTAAFDEFDGKHVEFAAPYSNTFINVTTSGNTVSIETIP